jgi:hypothetical protein
MPQRLLKGRSLYLILQENAISTSPLHADERRDADYNTNRGIHQFIKNFLSKNPIIAQTIILKRENGKRHYPLPSSKRAIIVFISNISVHCLHKQADLAAILQRA